jgi:hypothetical protein
VYLAGSGYNIAHSRHIGIKRAAAGDEMRWLTARLLSDFGPLWKLTDFLSDDIIMILLLLSRSATNRFGLNSTTLMGRCF